MIYSKKLLPGDIEPNWLTLGTGTSSTTTTAQPQDHTITNQINDQPTETHSNMKKKPKVIWTTERRLKHSKRMREYHKEHNLSLQTRLKMSKSATGRPVSEASRLKMSKSRLGKTRSEETKKKIRESILRHVANQKAIKKNQ